VVHVQGPRQAPRVTSTFLHAVPMFFSITPLVTSSSPTSFAKRNGTRGKAKISLQKTYNSVLKEPDPVKVLPLLESAILVLERRFAEWGTEPGTKVELKAILKAISILQWRLSRLPKTQRNCRKSA
jgi:hypothetical protein